ncbi:MAG: STAS domain-containing protein [Agathobacter sp.]|nr:STAS domain-containing protein [Agathobacter sp.]
MKYQKLPGEDYQVNGQVLTFYMPKELDHHVAKDLCIQLDALIESYVIKELVLDFKETEFMDSSGIGVIIGRGKTMQFRGGKIYATNMGKRVQMIFQSVGLERMVEVKEGN